jgi:Putative peptidoglycan binding domain
MPFPHMSPRLLATAFLIVCLVFCLGLPIQAKNKRGRRVDANSKVRLQTHSKYIRNRNSYHRKAGRHHKDQYRRMANDVSFRLSQANPDVPDNIEVFEHGSPSSEAQERLFTLPSPPNPSTSSTVTNGLSTPIKHKNVRMDSTRVMQIQQALNGRGFYQGERTGVYDDATIDAMRRFQATEKIPVTGYPTAHALKRLGLTSW